VQLKINGQWTELPDSTDLEGVLRRLGIPRETALIEWNQRALLRSEWPLTRLADGDEIEILKVAAGG
jgi:thiamine biosynthesis protein ThiS